MTRGNTITEFSADDHLALDALAEWLSGNPAARRVAAAEEHADGTIEIALQHEHGRAQSVTQRTLGKAIRSAIASARVAGCEP